MENSRETILSQRLDDFKTRFINGNKSALLEAVKLCASSKLVMPEWVAAQFMMALRQWETFEVRTLDEAFSVQRPKGFRLATEREFLQKSIDVYLALLAAEEQGWSISIGTNGAIEEVAKAFGINRDKVWKMYNHVRRNTPIGRHCEKKRKNRKKQFSQKKLNFL